MQNKPGKKLYSIPEAYRITLNAFRSIPYLKQAKKSGEMNEQFMERIMLAVTEVNGCAMCSYYHTKVALESGMSNDEIRNMLCGDCADAPDNEMQAILFAQHYADTRGNPSKETWKNIQKIYGEGGSYGVLAAIRMIVMGKCLWHRLGIVFKSIPWQTGPTQQLTV